MAAVGQGDGHVAVGGAERLERRGDGMPRAERLRDLARGEVPAKGVLQDGHLAVEHGDVHELAQPAAAAFLKRCENADHGVEAGGDVALRDAGTNGRPARLPGDAHDAAHALHNHVQRPLAGIGAVLSEAGYGGVDDARVALRQDGVVEAQPAHGARRQVLDDHVRAVDEPEECVAASGHGQVECDAQLSAVDAHEVGALAVDEGAAGAGAVANLGLLDLDDLCAEVGQGCARERARQDVRNVQHDHTAQWTGHGA